MTEAAVVNLFTVLRVLVVGGFLLILPLITRKGLLFGAYVGEEVADGDAARGLLRRWYLGCLTLMALALVVGFGISLAGRPLAGNLTATAILLLAALVLYLRLYYASRGLAPPAAARQAEQAVAILQEGEPQGAAFAKLALGICILVGFATIVYAMVGYDTMPDRIPTQFDRSGVPTAWVDKSAVAVTFAPSVNLVISSFIALIALLTARAKRSVRGGSGGRSAEAQEAFRAAMANLLSWTSLLVCALMTFVSVQIVRIGLSETQIRPVVIGFVGIAAALVVFMFGALIRIVTKYGQGGALLEEGSAEAPLTNGLADNAHWVWGFFYVDKDDPSIMVEKRFGIGYAFNYGNRKAVLIMATFLVLILGLAALGVMGAIF
jgi:uncharacterized membrane protein